MNTSLPEARLCARTDWFTRRLSNSAARGGHSGNQTRDPYGALAERNGGPEGPDAAWLERGVIGCGVLPPHSPCNLHGIVHELGGYTCRRCGAYDGGIVPLDTDLVRAMWNQAGASVQWRPR